MQASPTSPHDTYSSRLTDRRRAAEDQRRVENRLSVARLLLFLGWGALTWAALVSGIISWGWILLPAPLFLGAVLLHDRVIRRRGRAERAAAFYQRALDRVDDRWAGAGESGEAYLDRGHPYAADLDLFGHGSLFELLCTARTRTGERTLARWLCEPATPEEVRGRQQAVDELRPMLDLREELALLGETAEGVDAGALISWGAGEPLLTRRWPVIVSGVLAAVNLAAGVPWMVTGIAQELGLWAGAPVGRTVFLVSALASALVALYWRGRVGRVLAAVNRPERELELLSGILARLERQRFRTPKLVRLRAALDDEGQPPSRRIRRLARLVQINDSRGNMMFAPIAALLLLGTQLAFAMERWRTVSGPSVARWLAAVGEIEALSALASFAYERPDHPFPEIVDRGPCLEGEGVGHPLLPDSSCVRNDVRLGHPLPLQLLLVSGSNMSGKSTFLRTLGINTVLALAGGPVRARRLRLSPLAVGACMRVQDSLQEGMSHFYAEIKRLRQIVDLGRGPVPLLFLLDEILHGTNSHDRRVGAEALIRGLLEQGALGLVTTHDLALAEIAERLGEQAANVHFEDHLEGERIVFDYKVRPGVVRKSNALGLMRAVGLDV